LLVEFTSKSGTGIVDQYADLVVVAQARLDLCQIVPTGEISGKNVDGDAGISAKPGGQSFHSRAVAGDQNQIVAAPGQAIGIGCSDARRGAGDEDGRQLGHNGSLHLVT
jgi:hypothetical protein